MKGRLDILDICIPELLTQKVLEDCNSFSCGDKDMDEFFYKEALAYTHFRMGKSNNTLFFAVWIHHLLDSVP